jgi:diacylglycerol kinase family enzyme
MRGARRIWLVVNDASGGNSEDALAALKRSCAAAGFALDRVLAFPKQPLPSEAALGHAGVELVAVYAGDGTVNALVSALAGWQGAVLVLPGGTMNLLCRRLHGDRDVDKIVRLAAAGGAERRRPKVLACDQGTAFADLLAGPGTRWYEVREAMRQADVPAVAASAASALDETLRAPGIACRHPALGRPEGYPLVMLTPTDSGIHVNGFRAETPAEFLKESWAVLRRRFREGPRDELGVVEQVTLASTADEPFGLLLDGEKAESRGEAVFRLVPCEVDLLATEPDGR